MRGSYVSGNAFDENCGIWLFGAQYKGVMRAV
jgi:hypothetical protein